MDGLVANELLQKVEIGFEDIQITLKQKKQKEDRLILDGSIRGKALPGRMLAIMGPSGSGKSSLLHALGGKLKADTKITARGLRYVNGEAISGDSMIPAAFIEQDVNFFPHMTVKETLDFRVELKMGRKLTKDARDDLVQDLMDQLSLTKSANTIVGNAKIRGISGGEKKRLSIACEMIDSPPVIFLDEPTSGLDSYQAAQVVETMRALANSGKTIISVIHQPSQHIFAMFDDLLLLSEGKQMYFGEVSNVRSYIDGLGYSADSDTGTAEYVLESISGTILQEGTKSIADEGRAQSKSLVITESSEPGSKKKVHHIMSKASRPASGLIRQFKILLNRSFHEVLRGKGAIVIKLVQQVTLGMIYGGIYSLGNNQASIQDRIGLISLIAIGTMNLACGATIRSFPKEKAIVTGEMGSKLYSTFPYFLAKAISEIPLIGVFSSVFGAIIYPLAGLQKGRFKQFLGFNTLHSIASEAVGLLIGSISANSDIAIALFPPIIVLNVIFDGKNISEESTPRLLKWIPKFGLVRWGFEGMALNEFHGLTFETSGPRRGPVAKTGEEALERFGLLGNSLRTVVNAQMTIISVCWLLSFMGLSLTGQKYEVMLEPENLIAGQK
eukprot:scaffold209912_cov54-Attheya_sp.AAC.2